MIKINFFKAIHFNLLKLLTILFCFQSLGCTGSGNKLENQVYSTASKQVFIMKDYFEIPGLNRKRSVRIYLPPGYDDTSQKYPVLYMHDGQNLFDDATSYVGEWKIDETLNELSASNNFNIIVVGVDHGGDKRHLELSPWDNKKYGIAEGKQYLDFIVNTLKPFIDNKYRTLKNRENTAIMGSSMGGLISHYALIKYHNVFSKAGIFSPAYWYASDAVFKFTKNSSIQTKSKSKIYLLVGSKEGDRYLDLFKKMKSLLLSKGFDQKTLRTKIKNGAEHNESLWSSEFKQAISWLFDVGEEVK